MDILSKKNLKKNQEKKSVRNIVCNLQSSRSINKLPITKSLNIEPIKIYNEQEDYEEIRNIISLISPRNEHNNKISQPFVFSPIQQREDIRTIRDLQYPIRLRKSVSPTNLLSQEKKNFKFRKGFNLRAQVLINGKSIGKFTSIV